MRANKATGDARTRKDGRAQPTAAVDAKTRRGVMRGCLFVGVCAAGISSPSLFDLAEMGDLKWWFALLLPASLDGYAFISMWFADRVPARHPARASALRNSALALVLTVACNYVYHLLVLAGPAVSLWPRSLLLATVLALPPFIVGRVLHLRALADNGGHAEVVTTQQTTPDAGPSTTPAHNPAPVGAQPGNPVVTTGDNRSADNRPGAAKTVVDNPASARAEADVPRVVPKAERLRIVRALVAERGRDVPLAVIADAIKAAGGRCDNPAASKLRSAVREELDADEGGASEPDGEPERVGEAV